MPEAITPWAAFTAVADPVAALVVPGAPILWCGQLLPVARTITASVLAADRDAGPADPDAFRAGWAGIAGRRRARRAGPAAIGGAPRGCPPPPPPAPHPPPPMPQTRPPPPPRAHPPPPHPSPNPAGAPPGGAGGPAPPARGGPGGAAPPPRGAAAVVSAAGASGARSAAGALRKTGPAAAGREQRRRDNRCAIRRDRKLRKDRPATSAGVRTSGRPGDAARAHRHAITRALGACARVYQVGHWTRRWQRCSAPERPGGGAQSSSDGAVPSSSATRRERAGRVRHEKEERREGNDHEQDAEP